MLPKYQIRWERIVEEASRFISSTDLRIRALLVDMLLPETQSDLQRYQEFQRTIDEGFEKAREATDPVLARFYRDKAGFSMAVADQLLNQAGGKKIIHHAAHVLAPELKSNVLTIPTIVFSALPTLEKAITFSWCKPGTYRWFDIPCSNEEVCQWLKERLVT